MDLLNNARSQHPIFTKYFIYLVSQISPSLMVRLRICLLFPVLRGMTSTKKGCPSYHNELDLIARLQMCLLFSVLKGMTSTKRDVLYLTMNWI